MRKFSKHGSATVFLSIILSALILVESTYLLKIVVINRSITIDRALKIQIESILSSYNRELYEYYGIYAFTSNEVNDTIFCNALLANNVDPNGSLVIENVEVMTIDELRLAIANFYSYRGGAIAMDSMMGLLSNVINLCDDFGIKEKISEFTSSGAYEYFSQAISDSREVSKILEVVSYFPGVENLESKIQQFLGFVDSINQTSGNQVNQNLDFNVNDASSLIGILDTLNSVNIQSADFIDNYAFHLVNYHYASYNFDCVIPQQNDEGELIDESLQGGAFAQIHDSNCFDVEYIMSGSSGLPSIVYCGQIIYCTVQISNIVQCLLDPERMSIVNGIAEIIDAIVIVLTGGVLALPPELYSFIIVNFMVLPETISNMIDLYDGEGIALFDFLPLPDGISDVVQVGYRDILCFFMFFVPDSVVLERMMNVISRDYGELSIGMSFSYNQAGQMHTFEDGYQMYS